MASHEAISKREEVMVFHPQLGEDGLPVRLLRPSVSGPLDAWLDPNAVATLSVTDNGPLPDVINGLAFTRDDLKDGDFARIHEALARFVEPDFPQTEKHRTSGLVIVEPDARIWLSHPSNQFAGVEATFPKGRLAPGFTLVVNAVKEAWEETGLIAEPTAWLCDIERTKTVTRYYLARRTGGSPRFAGWETQAVSLVPAKELVRLLNRPNDLKVLPCLYEALNLAEDDAIRTLSKFPNRNARNMFRELKSKR